MKTTSEGEYIFWGDAHDSDKLEKIEQERFGHSFQLECTIEVFAIPFVVVC